MFEHYRSRVFLALLALFLFASGILTFIPRVPLQTAVLRKPRTSPAPAQPSESSGTTAAARPSRPATPAARPHTNRIEEKPERQLSTVPTEEAASLAGPEVTGLPTLIHTVKPGESVEAIAYRYLPQTAFMMTGELETAIRQANPAVAGKHLQPGQKILIPGIETMPVEELRPDPRPKDAEIRAIYLTGYTAGSAHGLELIRRWKELGGNAVVFDLKDFDGLVNVSFSHPLAPEKQRPPIRSLSKFVRFLRCLNLQSIGRIALFRDEQLATHHPDLAVQSRRAKAAWRENGKLTWADPSRREVQDYNIALAAYAARKGVDEIQFDYVRFPAEGDQADAEFRFQSERPEWTRAQVITDFLRRAYDELHPLGVLVSLDVFGVMAWERPVDLAHTGQKIEEMARHCDVLSPMVYPSHFFGMDGYTTPGDAPEHFIGESMDRFRKVTTGSNVVLRPWLQAFAWKTRSYSPDYVHTQMKVAREKGGIGYLFWNARNDYSVPFKAIIELNARARHSPSEVPALLATKQASSASGPSAPISESPVAGIPPQPTGTPDKESPVSQGAGADR